VRLVPRMQGYFSIHKSIIVTCCINKMKARHGDSSL
jgi:hypothetical protein